MNYLDFIENYDDDDINLFEKVFLVINRAKDLSDKKTITFQNKNNYKFLDCALLEVNKKNICADFSEKIDEKKSLDLSKENIFSDLEQKEDNYIEENEELIVPSKVDFDEDKE